MQRTGPGLIVAAAVFAERKHRGQTRKGKDATPYITHPLALAAILAEEGRIDDPVALAAAILHDTVEDTETSAEELAAGFGRRVASVVLEVTDDKKLPKQMRKRLQVEHAPRLSRRARLVKLADKIANVRDLLADPPARWPTRRKLAYVQWAARVVDGVRGTHAGLEAAFDAVRDEGLRRFGRGLAGVGRRGGR
ncbi:MAG: HD domain-containing protein [Solirubrobacteraceae bacterium]|jgi:guanosine-3',5'-bis(diphosphate) 3'-pyrophosphohydrolase|nr:HD domain-containing protein [Solirubrobacteraceae bacterium]